MEMEIETTCQKCGKPFTPAHIDYIKGTWRTCPPCRQPPAKKGA